MVLRLDDTDVERNTEASVNSIFEGLKWLGLGWDEEYKQSERLALHQKTAWAIFERAWPTATSRRRTPETPRSPARRAHGCSIRGCANFRAKRATGGPLPESRLRCVFACRAGRASKCVRRRGVRRAAQGGRRHRRLCFAALATACRPIIWRRVPTTLICASRHIIRGQDHLTNTFKHVLIFEAAGAKSPQFAHLPLLVAPDGTKLSKRRHGPVVSVTTYRDAGFLPEAFINFLCLLGWSPKNDREQLSLAELQELFSLEGINRANAVVNFKEPATTPEETFDPKAVWLNAEHIRGFAGGRAECAPVADCARSGISGKCRRRCCASRR